MEATEKRLNDTIKNKDRSIEDYRKQVDKKNKEIREIGGINHVHENESLVSLGLPENFFTVKLVN